jgi:hypothetical protein
MATEMLLLAREATDEIPICVAARNPRDSHCFVVSLQPHLITLTAEAPRLCRRFPGLQIAHTGKKFQAAAQGANLLSWYPLKLSTGTLDLATKVP